MEKTIDLKKLDQESQALVRALLDFKAEFGAYGVGYLVGVLNEHDSTISEAIYGALLEMRAD